MNSSMIVTIIRLVCVVIESFHSPILTNFNDSGRSLSSPLAFLPVTFGS